MSQTDYYRGWSHTIGCFHDTWHFDQDWKTRDKNLGEIFLAVASPKRENIARIWFQHRDQGVRTRIKLYPSYILLSEKSGLKRTQSKLKLIIFNSKSFSFRGRYVETRKFSSLSFGRFFLLISGMIFLLILLMSNGSSAALIGNVIIERIPSQTLFYWRNPLVTLALKMAYSTQQNVKKPKKYSSHSE